jgi:hypothetical protein
MVAASSRKGNRMTWTIEHTKRTGANLVQAEDILTPEELARLFVSLCSPV